MVDNRREAIEREIDALLLRFGKAAESDEIRSVALSRMDELCDDGWDERAAWIVARGAAWIAGVNLGSWHSGPRRAE